MPPRLVPSLFDPVRIARQTASLVIYAGLTHWPLSLKWLLSRGFRTLPVAAGAIGMGCIGFPNHPVWEITSACNESCIHCHAAGGRRGQDELTTAEGKRLIEEIARCREFRMLVFTGGEPLVRPDIMELLAHSWKVGFRNVMATNGIEIDIGLAKELYRLGVRGLAISLDHSTPSIHNRIRRRHDAFDRAIRAMHACCAAGMVLQVNITAMADNFDDLENLYGLAAEMNAAIVLNYQLVPVGRGAAIADRRLTQAQNESLLRLIRKSQKKYRTIIEPVAGPQFWPLLLGAVNGAGQPEPGLFRRVGLMLSRYLFHGCTAGRGLAYIKPNGEVWACPFIEVSAGNVRERPFDEIWRHAELFVKLRDRDLLRGSCGTCRGRHICGGCRGRALAVSGDLLAEDPACFMCN